MKKINKKNGFQMGTKQFTPLLIAGIFLLLAAMVFIPNASLAQLVQQGGKLASIVTIGPGQEGSSTAISGDGNTIITGGMQDNGGVGAAWVYHRSGGVWSQMNGGRLVGYDHAGLSFQGCSVSLSSDGNYAIVGGYGDNNNIGAVWFYVYNGTVWSPLGVKHIGTGASGIATQGLSVSMSADGLTAAVGGNADSNGIGAVWIYTRTGSSTNSVWSQQGNKLVGAGGIYGPEQGFSVSISANGNTLIEGGNHDNIQVGAAWVFTRNGPTWSSGVKLASGTGAIGIDINQGVSVSISGDGKTAMVGGDADNGYIGAVWVYLRDINGNWSQQGNKLVGTNQSTPFQGTFTSLSYRGDTALIGGSLLGGAWVYVRSLGVWSLYGCKLVGTGTVGDSYQGYGVSISSDGKTAVEGGPHDNNYIGAAWVFVPYVSPTIPVLSASVNPICYGHSTTLSLTGTLHDATNWYWYSSSCGGTPVGNGLSVSVSPTVTTTYYARGERDCTTPGSCGSIIITVSPIPTVNSVANQTLCKNAYTTSVFFAGSLTGTTFNWTNNNTAIGLATSGTGNILSFMAGNPGNTPISAIITVTPTKNGCTGPTTSFTVTVNPLPTISTATATTICVGSSVTLSATGANTYTWMPGSLSGASIVVSPTITTTYTVTGTSLGCTGTATRVINVNPVPTVNSVANQTLCKNAYTTSVFFAGSLTGTTFNWTNNNTAIGLATSGTGNILSFVAVNTGVTPITATITVTPIKSGCTGTTTSFTVTVNPLPTISTAAAISSCVGSSVTLSATGANTYTWMPGSLSGASIVVSPTITTTYTVTGTSLGCTGTATRVVNVNPVPTVNSVANQTLCKNAYTTSVFFAGSLTGTTFNWTNNNTAIGLATSGTGNILSFVAGNPGNTPITATITVTPIKSGCTGTSINFSIIVNPIPTIISSTSATSVCAGVPVTLSATGANTYTWMPGNLTGATVIVSPNTTTTYTVTGTSPNGCIGSTTRIINVNPAVTGLNIPTPAAVCGSETVSLTASLSGLSYLWSNSATSQAITVTISTSTTYTVTATNSYNCSASAQTTAVIHVNPVPIIHASGPTAFCNGGSVYLNVIGTYATYQWNNNGPATQAFGTPVTATGDYCVTVSYSPTGCTHDTCIHVEVSPSPGITASGPTTFCMGGNVNLHAGLGNNSYLWNTGATTETITVSTNGTYSVTTTGGACSGVSSIVVTVIALPIVYATPVSGCAGTNIALIGSPTSGGTGVFNPSSPYSNNTAGIYTYTYTFTESITGCTGTSSPVNITVYALPTPAGTDVSGCAGTNITLIGSPTSGGTGIFSPSSPYNNTIPGTYTYTYTFSESTTGCTATSTPVNITVNPLPQVIPHATATTICSGTTATLTGSGALSYSWSNGVTDGIPFSPTSTTTYTVTGTNANGCSDTASITIVVNPYVAANATITALGYQQYCIGFGNITDTAALNASYLWNTGATTRVLTVTPGNDGTYCVTVTNFSGCTASSCMVISSACVPPTLSYNATTVIGAHSAIANWVQAGCVTGYNIELLNMDNNFDTIIVLSPANNHKVLLGLIHNTNYCWRIQTRCDTIQHLYSTFTPYTCFTTSARLEADIVTNSVTTFNVFPNPASNQATISFNSDKEESFTIRMLDVTGRMVINKSNRTTIGENQYQLNLTDISKGIYLVILQNDAGILQKKLIVE